MPRNKYHDTPVVEFHEVFGAPVAWKPTVPDYERRVLRCRLILEEFLEFVEASGLTLNINGRDALISDAWFSDSGEPIDLVEAADALGDLRVVIDGSNLEWGFPGEKILREIHRSNMSKAGADGKPIVREDGKILKGPHFTLPQIAEILELYSGVENG